MIYHSFSEGYLEYLEGQLLNIFVTVVLLTISAMAIPIILLIIVLFNAEIFIEYNGGWLVTVLIIVAFIFRFIGKLACKGLDKIIKFYREIIKYNKREVNTYDVKNN